MSPDRIKFQTDSQTKLWSFLIDFSLRHLAQTRSSS